MFFKGSLECKFIGSPFKDREVIPGIREGVERKLLNLFSPSHGDEEVIPISEVTVRVTLVICHPDVMKGWGAVFMVDGVH